MEDILKEFRNKVFSEFEEKYPEEYKSIRTIYNSRGQIKSIEYYDNSLKNSEDFPQENSEDFPQENSEDFPQENSGNSPQENSGNSPQENSGNSPQENSGNFPQENSGNFPYEIDIYSNGVFRLTEVYSGKTKEKEIIFSSGKNSAILQERVFINGQMDHTNEYYVGGNHIITTFYEGNKIIYKRTYKYNNNGMMYYHANEETGNYTDFDVDDPFERRMGMENKTTTFSTKKITEFYINKTELGYENRLIKKETFFDENNNKTLEIEYKENGKDITRKTFYQNEEVIKAIEYEYLFDTHVVYRGIIYLGKKLDGEGENEKLIDDKEEKFKKKLNMRKVVDGTYIRHEILDSFDNPSFSSVYDSSGENLKMAVGYEEAKLKYIEYFDHVEYGPVYYKRETCVELEKGIFYCDEYGHR